MHVLFVHALLSLGEDSEQGNKLDWLRYCPWLRHEMQRWRERESIFQDHCPMNVDGIIPPSHAVGKEVDMQPVEHLDVSIAVLMATMQQPGAKYNGSSLRDVDGECLKSLIITPTFAH